MKKARKKIAAFIVAVLSVTAVFSTESFADGGSFGYKGSNMIEYYGDYDMNAHPFKTLDSVFTNSSIEVDGVLEDAYNASNVSRIENLKSDKGYGLEQSETYGELRSLWDGPVLYMGITVYDECVLTSTETNKGPVSNPAVAGTETVTYPYASWGGFWATWAVTSTKETCDSVAIGVDLYDDRTTYEIDTAGLITIDALGNLYYYHSSNIPSLGSPLGDPEHPEYMNIIKDYAAAPLMDEEGDQIGYNIELALQIEDLRLDNGTKLGFDVKINDINDIVTGYDTETVENPEYAEYIASISDNDTESHEGDEASESDASDDPSRQDTDSQNDNVTPEEQQDFEGQTEEIGNDVSSNEDVSENDAPVPVDQGEDDDSDAEGQSTDAGPDDVNDTGNEAEEDVSASDVSANEIPPQYIEVKTPIYSEAQKSAGIFWSHEDDGLYTDYDHEHAKSVDWGEITLAGWNGSDEFAYSEWRIKKIIDYIDSASFAKGVYTADSQARLDAAVTTGRIVLNSTYKDKAYTESVAADLEAAFKGLKWGDTRYPDPSDLERLNTLPNPYKFFNSDKVVTNNEQWQQRRAEILDLAQFYEYGYKPEYDSLTVKSASYHAVGDPKKRWSNSQGKYVDDGTYTSTGASFTATVKVGSRSKDISFDVEFPTDAQLEASGHKDEKLPIVLSFDGSISSYLNAGIAMISLPSVVSDTRTNEYAWGNRTGTFYDLYPYSRNGSAALNEVSNEMASAWGASVVIDTLEAAAASDNETIRNSVSALAIDKLAVTGFSINGKYAFVSAVFDDRIDVCIPGAAGATGPSPWRYVYRGQKYDFTDTIFASDNSEPSVQTAWGTEVMANSIRHNRVRETELFRHFLSPGHFYEFEEGAYGYGTRLPYDQSDLVATLAPRAIIIENTVNDYNDGCTADALSAEVAKSVYNTLGYEADDLVKFNYRNVKSGDPHGNDSAQRSRSAEYLNYYFFGTKMSDTTDNYLNTDPYNLKISNGNTETPYDYYWGGFNTITGGTNGAGGRDGWYYYSFPKPSGGNGSSNSGGNGGNNSGSGSNNSNTDSGSENNSGNNGSDAAAQTGSTASANNNGTVNPGTAHNTQTGVSYQNNTPSQSSADITGENEVEEVEATNTEKENETGKADDNSVDIENEDVPTTGNVSDEPEPVSVPATVSSSQSNHISAGSIAAIVIVSLGALSALAFALIRKFLPKG